MIINKVDHSFKKMNGAIIDNKNPFTLFTDKSYRK